MESILLLQFWFGATVSLLVAFFLLFFLNWQINGEENVAWWISGSIISSNSHICVAYWDCSISFGCRSFCAICEISWPDAHPSLVLFRKSSVPHPEIQPSARVLNRIAWLNGFNSYKTALIFIPTIHSRGQAQPFYRSFQQSFTETHKFTNMM